MGLLGVYDQLEEYAQRNTTFNLNKSGDGHTGFALAKVLKAPFIVLRSAAHRHKANEILKEHIGNDGLIVLTGHGRPGTRTISGNYLSSTHQAPIAVNQPIERSPSDIVSSLIEAGLESNCYITVLLSICFGAVKMNNEASFAEKLAIEFANHGISTTIIASTKSVLRFGSEVIQNGTITFNKKIGMDAPDIRVFTTQVDSPTSSPIISIYKPKQAIQVTEKGLHFIRQHSETLNKTPTVPIIETHNVPLTQNLGENNSQVREKRQQESNELDELTLAFQCIVEINPLQSTEILQQQPPQLFLLDTASTEVNECATETDLAILPEDNKEKIQFQALCSTLITQIQNYLSWRTNKDSDDPRGYPLGFFTKIRHYTEFGQLRAEHLKSKLNEADDIDEVINILQEHLSNNSTLHNHSLDTYLLEGIMEHQHLLNMEHSFNLREDHERHELRELLVNLSCYSINY